MKKVILYAIAVLLLITHANGEVLITDYQNSAPKFYFTKDGKAVGLCVDIIEELNSRLKAEGITIIPNHKEVVPLKRILISLERGKIDLFVGTSRNKRREKIYNFADHPLYELREVFVKRKSDPFEYTDKKSLTGKRIVSLFGSNTAKHIFSVEGVKPHEVSSIEQILKVLMAGRADLAYYHNLGIEYYIRTMGIKSKTELVKKPFYKKYHYIGFSRKVSKQTIAKIDKALISMYQNGVIEEIRKKYK
ncbi:MAG: amino acid ABC transporter substrate-binding protein [Desulfobacterales bacterium]|nr:amino acid ABC transporter substrate-binding protein [Desulfobacterales bacterium]